MQPDKDYFRKSTQIYEKLASIHQAKRNLWISDVVFTWQWWLGVILTILPWIIWVLYRKKESTYRLLASGFFVIGICSWFDAIGVALGMWHYNFDVMPMLPSYLPWDFTILPVLVMSLIQYKPQINPFVKAVVFGGICAFLGEPLFTWLRLYEPQNWRNIYSFPIFIVIYLIAHLISSRKQFGKVGI